MRDLAPEEWLGLRAALTESLLALVSKSVASFAAFMRDSEILRQRLVSVNDGFRREKTLHTNAARELAAHCTSAVQCLDELRQIAPKMMASHRLSTNRVFPEFKFRPLLRRSLCPSGSCTLSTR